MALGFAQATGQSILDAFLNATAYTGTSTPFVKLHIGDPGSAGTANAAGNTTRQALSVGAAAIVSNVATVTSDAGMTWTSVSTSETYTHFSIWTASSAGTFLGSGTCTANAVTAGDTFSVPTGNFTWTVSTAA